VGIGIHRETDLAMAQGLHDGARIHSLREQQRRTRMAQVIESLVRQTGPDEQPLVGTEDIARDQRLAMHGHKDQPVLLPLLSSYQTLLQLACVVGSQRGAVKGIEHEVADVEHELAGAKR